jgi:hypothetical protein
VEEKCEEYKKRMRIEGKTMERIIKETFHTKIYHHFHPTPKFLLLCEKRKEEEEEAFKKIADFFLDWTQTKCPLVLSPLSLTAL